MIERSFGVTLMNIGKILLPLVVGGLSVGYMTFQRQPVLGTGNNPVVGQSQSYLRNRTGIDAQGL